MMVILEDNAQSRGMGGGGTHHRRTHVSALPFIRRSQSISLDRHARYGYRPRYCRLRESALTACMGVKLSMQASSE
jgi:hypothetical protein